MTYYMWIIFNLYEVFVVIHEKLVFIDYLGTCKEKNNEGWNERSFLSLEADFCPTCPKQTIQCEYDMK